MGTVSLSEKSCLQMKIYQIHKKYPGGGAAKIAADLHLGYQARHQEVLMISGEQTPLHPGFILDMGSPYPFLDETFGPLFLRGLSKFLKISGLRHWKSVREWQAKEFPRWERITKGWKEFLGREYFGYRGIWEWMKDLREWPDVIQCHTIEGDYFDWTSLPVMAEKSAVVLTMHNAWILTGLCHHSLGCDRWKKGCGECPQLSDYSQYRRDASDRNWEAKVRLFEKRNLYVNTPCEWLMAQVDQSVIAGKVAGKKVIHNGVDEKIFSPGDKVRARKELGLPEDAVILIFVANKTVSNKWKRTDWMLEALRKLKAEDFPNKIIFLMLGQTGEEKREAGFTSIMAGHVSDPAKVAQYYQASDIYIHAALMDTFPNVVLEAMSCGLPVIATRVGGIPEQVVDGETGYLCEPGNSDEMADQISTLILNGNLRKKLGSAAHLRVLENFTVIRMVENYLAWFQEICGNRP